MRYEQYYQRIFKLKKARDFLIRFRVLILSITGFVLALTSTLVSVKGIVQEEVFFANTITYGERYTPTASAVFGEAEFEYAVAGSSTWVAEQPVLVGNYQVRSKAENNFDGYYYGQTHFFSIVPKPIEIEFLNSSILYGERPNIRLHLAYQDTLNGYEIVFEDFATRQTFMEVDLASLSILNRDGLDVTSCYRITQEKAPISFLPRPLTYAFQGGSKAYDEQPIFNNQFVSTGTFAFDDYPVIGDSLAQVGIGVTANLRTVNVFNANDQDVTHLYDISFTTENLVVVPRPLVIQSPSRAKMYDGLPFEDDTFEVQWDNLLPGHVMHPTFDHQDVYEVSELTNSFSYYITDENDDVVTNLYAINVRFGALEITSRPLQVNVQSAQKIYDATPLAAPTYVITNGTLAATDSISSVCEDTITEVGLIENDCTFEVLHTNGEIVTDNYELNAVPGELLIEQQPLAIQLTPLSKMYDGAVLTGDQFEISGTLMPNHQVVQNDIPTPRNAGVYDNLSTFTILDDQGIDVTRNYDLTITGQASALTITQRPLSLETESSTRMYNGTPLRNLDYTITGGSLAVNDVIVIDGTRSASVTNVGTLNNVLEVVIRNNNGNGQVVTSNYLLDVQPGELSITPFETITITSLNQTKVYDDQPFQTSSQLAYSLSRTLFSNDRISAIRITSDQVDVGQGGLTIDPSSIVIQNSSGQTITSNYTIVIVNSGQLNVTKRFITVNMANLQKTYDGQPLVAQNQFSVTGAGLAPGHAVSIGSPTPQVSITNVSQSPATTNSTVTIRRTSTNTDVTSNYQITKNEGSLTLFRRPITVTTNSATKIFDGDPLTYIPTANVTTGSLVPGHQLVTTFTQAAPNPTNTWETVSNTATFRIEDSQQNDVTNNYLITNNFGTIRVNPRPLQIGIIPLTVEYNGSLQGYQTPVSDVRNNTFPLYIRTGTLPTGYRMESGVTIQGIYAGTYTNFVTNDFKIYDSNNQVADLRNFTITKHGSVTIAQRTIIIQSLGGTKDADGDAFPETKEIILGQLAPGDVIEYGDTPDMILPGVYTHTIVVIRITNNGVDVTSSYDIQRQEGTVIIQ